MMHRTALLCLAAPLALFACKPATHAAAQNHPLIGKAAPELEAEPVGGDGPKTLADAKGKVVVVDFWATYCKPCKKSFPVYQDIVDTHGGKVFVLAVSMDEADEKKPSDLMAFAEGLNTSFPLLWDKEQKTAKSYKPPTMPTAYIIDKEGVVRYVHAGYTPDEAAQVRKEIEGLL